MIKSELVKRLARRTPDLAAGDVAAAVDGLLAAMTATLVAGNRIEIRDFGSFSVTFRPARAGRNPKTGTRVEVPAKYAVHYKAGRRMREAANGCLDSEAGN